MNFRQYLLICLAEECSEVTQRATKALRFGLTETQPGQGLDNEMRLAGELTDLRAIVDLLREDGVVLDVNRADIALKKAKTLKYMGYSRTCGILESLPK